jgi:hypothetical protein
MGCNNSIVINESTDKVWAAIKNFHDLSWSANVVAKVDKIGDKTGNEIGAKRILNDAFHETLLSVDEKAKAFTYSIDNGPGPLASDAVSGYVGKVELIPVTADNSTFVRWTSKWESESGGVADFCNPIYHALLNDLKGHFS